MILIAQLIKRWLAYQSLIRDIKNSSMETFIFCAVQLAICQLVHNFHRFVLLFVPAAGKHFYIQEHMNAHTYSIVRNGFPAPPFLRHPTSSPFLKSLFPLPSFLFHPLLRYFPQFPHPRATPVCPNPTNQHSLG